MPNQGAFSAVSNITFPARRHPVIQTTAAALSARLEIPATDTSTPSAPGLHVTLDTAVKGCHIACDADGNGRLTADEPALLYAFAHWLLDEGNRITAEALAEGLQVSPTFAWHRPIFDQTLTQTGRTVRGFDDEAHIETLARSGFTHLEVNALAFHIPFEPGMPNEYYNQFYSYCAGLNQFVDSPLTRGIYPHEYLAANLNRLKHLAALGRKYGLKPGILCFEPRTLPEHFFQRYPTLRGARVDHPFRSHVPRYTLAQDHPVTQAHYRTMMQTLMQEVPELAYMSVWTNDSGAGFEHTASLYVGRNGGPYLIREWRNHEKIAQAAGESAVRYLRLLQRAASETNPDFEVILRLEPFKVEHDAILAGMGDGVTFEAPSLLVRGYHLPYSHPRYPEQESVAGSIYHTEMDASEEEKLAEYRARGVEPKVHYSVGSAFNMEPLLGIPFPYLLHQKIKALRDSGVRHANAFGGLLHTTRTPYWPHPGVIRAMQFTPERSIAEVLHDLAVSWAGSHASALVRFWRAIDEAVSYFPLVPLYSHFGFVWLRTWVRPFIPNLEAIPKEDRLYYERYLVSTPNNPSINDLGQDVLFELITQDSGRQMTVQWDENVLTRIDAVRKDLQELVGEHPVFTDLYDRVRALRCWAMTQRNTCAWVAGVYGYLSADTDAERKNYRAVIDDLMDLELDNAHALLDLWNTSQTEFMLISDIGETSYVYGENLGDLIERKIKLMEQYRHVEPDIDRGILWRI